MFIVYPGFNYLPVFRNIGEDTDYNEAYFRNCEIDDYNDIFKAADDEYIRGYTMNN